MLDRMRVCGSQCGLVNLALVVLALLVAGCRQPQVETGIVKGKVTFGDKPVTTGTIRFQSPTVSLGADLEADGSFEIKTHQRVGLPPGSYQVAIVPRVGPPAGNQPPMIAPASETPTPEFADIPEKFRDVSTSGLTATVTVGANSAFNFDLSK